MSSYFDLLPAPGEWKEADYLPFSERGRLVELSEGNVEILDPPTYFHQVILLRLAMSVQYVATAKKLGKVCFAPLPVRLWSGKTREPDLMFMSTEHASRIGEYWGVPDLAVEIISPSSAIKDRETKRREYAQAGVAEYWIVDLDDKIVEVLREAENGDYRHTARFANAEVLTSHLIEGFSLPLTELFAEP